MFPLLLLCIASTLKANMVHCDKLIYDLSRSEQLFEDFINTYSRSYSDETEKQSRLQIFKNNLVLINQLNSNSELAEFGVTKFSDLTEEEFVLKYTGFTPPSKVTTNSCQKITDKDVTTKDAPDSLNWVEKGVVTGVKNQGICGSCWAFSTIGNIEGQYAIKNKVLKSFSEQELVDCVDAARGCFGGNVADALTDLITIGGVELESNYPYKGQDRKCHFNSSKAVAKFDSCTNYNITDEVKFKEVVAKKGPISVAIDATKLGSYTKGIMKQSECNSEELNHAVLIVGYGTENGTDYWLIKNSWGVEFGEAGYFRIRRGENTCWVMNELSASADM